MREKERQRWFAFVELVLEVDRAEKSSEFSHFLPFGSIQFWLAFEIYAYMKKGPVFGKSIWHSIQSASNVLNSYTQNIYSRRLQIHHQNVLLLFSVYVYDAIIKLHIGGNTFQEPQPHNIPFANSLDCNEQLGVSFWHLK